MGSPWRQYCLVSSGLLAALLFNSQGASAQTLLSGSGPGGMVRIFNTDLAILEAQDPRKDLPCTVNNQKPMLGFDLKFHAGYEVTVPMNELAGSENLLTILFRVTPTDKPEDLTYFIQRVRVPQINEDAKGDAVLQGILDLGEGKYHVDWLMRDRTERVCSSYWDMTAELSAKDKPMALGLSANMVRATDAEQFKEEPPVERAQIDDQFNVKVLMNFAPQNAKASSMQPTDTAALVQILRSISREPKMGRFSLIAFNLQEQRVVYRQDNADKIDFPSLGEALSSLKLGTVDLARLGNKNGEAEFLSNLIRDEMGTSQHPDAVIFAGPKALLEKNVESEALAQVGEVDYPVFYMNYNLYPQQVPWKDAISHAVKFFRGQEYTISRPRDLWFAMSDLVGRVAKQRNVKRASAASTTQ